MSNATYTYDEDCYSDLYKDVYGFRPRGAVWEHWKNMTPAEKQVQWDYLRYHNNLKYGYFKDVT